MFAYLENDVCLYTLRRMCVCIPREGSMFVYLEKELDLEAV